jgi:hypothetical protein
MSSSVSTTQTPVSPLPQIFSLCYQMEFKIFGIQQIKKQLNKYNKLTHERFFDFELKLNNESPSFLLLPFLKKVFLFNSRLVKNDKITTEDYIEVNEIISILKKKMKKAIEKKYHESGTVKNCTVNLFEETNNLLDQIFNPEKVNKIMKINKPLIELFKTNYIHPKQYDIKDIFIEKKLKKSVPKNISDEEYIKELEEENENLKIDNKELKSANDFLINKNNNLEAENGNMKLELEKENNELEAVYSELNSKIEQIDKLRTESKDDKIYIKDNEENFFRLRIKYDVLEGKYNALYNDTADYDYIHVLDKKNKELVQELNHKEEVFNKLVVVSKDLEKTNKSLNEAINHFIQENNQLKEKISKKNKHCDCCCELWSKCMCMCGNCKGEYKICKYECYKK